MEAQKLSDFEKNFGLRIKKFCDDNVEGNRWKAPKDELLSDEYIDDAVKFRDSIKGNFLKYRSEFREVIDQLRTSEYESFASIGLGRKKKDTETTDKRIQMEKELLKQRIKQAGSRTNVFSGLIDGIDESSEENDDEFYNNDSDQDEGETYPEEEGQVINTTKVKQQNFVEETYSGTIPGSKPGVPTKLGASLLQT